MVKVFIPNKDGKIEFTRMELETLLNEVWQDGYNSNHWYWNSPTPYYNSPLITTDHTITVSLGGTET